MAEMREKPATAKRTFRWRGVKMLTGVLAAYLLLGIFNDAAALSALKHTGKILAEILPILGVVVFFSAAINYFFNPRQLARHLGEDGGVKGWLLSLGIGILSHGPMYAWYPMIEDLKHHGLRDGYIAAFFYARAIKVPLLPVMVHYFGWSFTVFLTIYILVGAWLQGVLIEKLDGASRSKNEKIEDRK